MTSIATDAIVLGAFFCCFSRRFELVLSICYVPRLEFPPYLLASYHLIPCVIVDNYGRFEAQSNDGTGQSLLTSGTWIRYEIHDSTNIPYDIKSHPEHPRTNPDASRNKTGSPATKGTGLPKIRTSADRKRKRPKIMISNLFQRRIGFRLRIQTWLGLGMV